MPKREALISSQGAPSVLERPRSHISAAGILRWPSKANRPLPRGAGKEPLPRRTEIPSRSERVIWAPVCLDLYLRNAQQDGPVGWVGSTRPLMASP